jgi:small subunit ribosomal protein S16
MAVHIRLRRTGTTKRPAYRVVVADSRAARDGRFIEVIGHYDPLTDPPTIRIETEKAMAWIKKGAQPTNTVRNLLARAQVEKGAGTPPATT